MIYLDHNATTATDKRVLEKMIPFFGDTYSNPSSVYRFAQEARRAVEDARDSIAALINADPQEIVFTCGGTEADNTAIKGVAAALKDKGRHIITSKIEHHAVLHSCEFLEKQGHEVTYLDVDENGLIDLAQFRKSLRDDTVLVSVMHANNEIGTIEPIGEIAAICREKNICVHTDAVQSVGKIKVDVKELEIDLLSLSGHKFYGPKGVGALYVRKGVKFESLLHGGGHEKNRRSGTENVPGIVGLGEAARIASAESLEEAARIKPLRDMLEAEIVKRIPKTKVNGHSRERLFNTLNICMKHIEGESILINLDFEGICASSGSACTSGSLEPSHVLLALGLDHETAHGSLRFSLGKATTEEEIKKVIEVLPPIVEKLRNMSPFWQGK
jgi:cysteine desulfurase